MGHGFLVQSSSKENQSSARARGYRLCLCLCLVPVPVCVPRLLRTVCHLHLSAYAYIQSSVSVQSFSTYTAPLPRC